MSKGKSAQGKCLAAPSRRHRSEPGLLSERTAGFGGREEKLCSIKKCFQPPTNIYCFS